MTAFLKVTKNTPNLRAFASAFPALLEISMFHSLTAFRPLFQCHFLREAFPDHLILNCHYPF